MVPPAPHKSLPCRGAGAPPAGGSELCSGAKTGSWATGRALRPARDAAAAATQEEVEEEDGVDEEEEEEAEEREAGRWRRLSAGGSALSGGWSWARAPALLSWPLCGKSCCQCCR